jgi:hypothetical protein
LIQFVVVDRPKESYQRSGEDGILVNRRDDPYVSSDPQGIKG